VADSPSSHYFSKTYQEHLNKINDLGLNKWK
jgi:cell division protein YceG involved in septum cleavage